MHSNDTMNNVIYILLIEDSENDALLLVPAY